MKNGIFKHLPNLVMSCAALGLAACAGMGAKPDELQEASRNPAQESSLNLRALRSVASVSGATEVAPIKAKDVYNLIVANWKAFDSDITLGAIKFEKNTIKLTIKKGGTALASTESRIPRCSLNEDGNSPDAISVALDGEFTLKKAGSLEYVTYESRGKVEGQDSVVKSMNLQFAVKPNGEKTLIGFDLYDVAGFTPPFNQFWSGKSVLCSRESPDSKAKTAQND